MGYKERTIEGYSKGNIDNMFKANEKLGLQLKDLKLENKCLKKDKKRLEKELQQAKDKIKELKEGK